MIHDAWGKDEPQSQEPQKEKFLVVLEIETNNLARDLNAVQGVIQNIIPDVSGQGWIVSEVLIDDVKAILLERGRTL